MSANLIGELVANNGTYFLPSSGTYIGNVNQIIVRGAGIEGVELFINVDGENVDVTSDYVGDSRLPNQLRITPKGDQVFSQVNCLNSDTPHQGLELVLA